MKKVAIGAGIVIALLVLGKVGLSYMFTQGEANNASERVRRLLDGMQPNGDRQRAIGLWYSGSLYPPGGDMFSLVANEFEDWMKAGKLGATIAAYEVTKATVLSETDKLGEAVVRVEGTIDGKPFSMRVVQGKPIQWAP